MTQKEPTRKSKHEFHPSRIHLHQDSYSTRRIQSIPRYHSSNRSLAGPSVRNRPARYASPKRTGRFKLRTPPSQMTQSARHSATKNSSSLISFFHPPAPAATADSLQANDNFTHRRRRSCSSSRKYEKQGRKCGLTGLSQNNIRSIAR